ncbi:uncharacterized protein LOC141907137 [Tubulanus polymorphus]|uniref:uncharacterized protein LOC141907137 n=1 Tax=Tubulanus polymorphus TaxID=672921 RepID=UPI003DA4838A
MNHRVLFFLALCYLSSCVRASGNMCGVTQCFCAGFRVQCQNKSLKEIPEPNSVGSAAIEYLNLDRNSIISLNNVQLFDKLKELTLSWNKISDTSALLTLEKLEVLDLSHNSIDYLDELTFGAMKNLWKINLSFNNLRILENHIFPATLLSLSWLDLSHNGMTEILPYAFGELPKFRSLDLSHNQLQMNKQDSKIFRGLGALESLSLQNNSMHDGSISSVFRYLSNLRSLHLDDNGIAELRTDSFANLTNLKNLTLSKNQLKEVPTDGLKCMPFLERLDLSINPIEGIWNHTFPLNVKRNLKFLNMSHTKINKIGSHTLRNITSLNTVDLSFCLFLENISPYAFYGSFHHISMVYLNDGVLNTLSPLLLPWDTLTVLTLNDNLWNCDCNLAWMNNSTFDITSNLRCSLPYDLAGKLISQVKPHEFICLSSYNHAVFITKIVLSIAAALIFISLVVLLLHRYKRWIPCLNDVPGKYVTLRTKEVETISSLVVHYRDDEVKTGIVEL